MIDENNLCLAMAFDDEVLGRPGNHLGGSFTRVQRGVWSVDVASKEEFLRYIQYFGRMEGWRGGAGLMSASVVCSFST